MGRVGQRHAPPALPPGKDPVPIVQEAGWAPGQVWTCEENLAPTPGFDPRTVQLVASRYTDWAIAAHLEDQYCWFLFFFFCFHLLLPYLTSYSFAAHTKALLQWQHFPAELRHRYFSWFFSVPLHTFIPRFSRFREFAGSPLELKFFTRMRQWTGASKLGREITGGRSCIQHDVQGVEGRQGSVCTPQSFCKGSKTLKEEIRRTFYGERGFVGRRVFSHSRTFSSCGRPSVGLFEHWTHHYPGWLFIYCYLLSRRRWEDNIEMALQEVGWGVN